jgi:adenosine deaminase CECR1
MIEGLLTYESAFRNYIRHLVMDFVKDNIQYAEVRLNLQGMVLKTSELTTKPEIDDLTVTKLRTDDGARVFGSEETIAIIEEVLQQGMQEIRMAGNYFQGLKVIYCAPRSIRKEQMENALDECIHLAKRFPHLICGKC